MAVQKASVIWRDYITDGDSGSGAHKPIKSQIREWAAELEIGGLVVPGWYFGFEANDNTKDATTALDEYNAFMQTEQIAVTIGLKDGTYYFQSQPDHFVEMYPFAIVGVGQSPTVLHRAYSGTNGVGFLEGRGTDNCVLRSLQITAEGTGGTIVYLLATTTAGASNADFDNITIASSTGSAAYQYAIKVDGTAKVTGSLGSRNHNWSRVTLFGGSAHALALIGVDGLNYIGAVLPAGGSGVSAGAVLIDGTSTVKSTNQTLIFSSVGGGLSEPQVGLDFGYAVHVTVIAPAITGKIKNTANSNDINVRTGIVYGAIETNWINSRVWHAYSKLPGNLSLYVNDNGSDTNNAGYEDTAAGAFLTIQKAIDFATTLDVGPYTLTIYVNAALRVANPSLAATTRTEALNLKPFASAGGMIRIIGYESDPTKEVIAPTTGNCVSLSSGSQMAQWSLRGFKLAPVASGGAIIAQYSAYLGIQNINFGACPSGYYHISSVYNAMVAASGALTISGGATAFGYCYNQGMIDVTGVTITLSGSPVLTYFWRITTGGYVRAISTTYSGSPTAGCTRYLIDGTGGGLQTSGATTSVPGSVAGSVTSPGWAA